jgi:hypothetical protein
MKYSTYIALTATVAVQAKNPNKIIDGVAFEAFQKDVLHAGSDAKKFVNQDLAPNVGKWWDEQAANEEQLLEDLQTFDKNSEKTFNDMITRGDVLNYDKKLENISNQLDAALDKLKKNANSNGYYARKNIRAGPVKLWSVGMTASKTQRVNSMMMKVAQDAMKFETDPV